MLTRDEVLLGFRLLLGREPDSERTIEYHRHCPSIAEFGRVLRESEEFQTRMARDRVALGELQRWIRAELPSGLSLWVDMHDDGVSAGILRGTWEPTETNFILSVVSLGDSVIDVGANLGWYTVALAQALGSGGHVFAFEPRPDIFAQLERSVRDNGLTDRCSLHRLALGADEGERDLAWSPIEKNQGHSFILPNGAFSPPELRRERVSVARLDSVGIERRIRLIKVDVEGAELEVLRGGRGLIARDRPIIVCEAFPKWLRRSGKTDVYTLLHALDDLDYRAHYLTDDGIGGEVHWPIPDFDSDYLYYSIVLLSAADRATLLDGRQDGRVHDLKTRIVEAERRMETLGRQAADAQGLTDGLASAQARAAAAEEEIGRLKRELATAEEETGRLKGELAAAVARAHTAQQRARAAEFDNLQVAGHVLLGTKPETSSLGIKLETPSLQAELTRLKAEIDTLRRSTSWRVTAPLRALRRTFIHSTAATRRGRRRS